MIYLNNGEIICIRQNINSKILLREKFSIELMALRISKFLMFSIYHGFGKHIKKMYNYQELASLMIMIEWLLLL